MCGTFVVQNSVPQSAILVSRLLFFIEKVVRAVFNQGEPGNFFENLLLKYHDPNIFKAYKAIKC